MLGKAVLVSRSTDGHRLSYIVQFKGWITARGLGVTVTARWWSVLVEKCPVFFLMVEEDLLGYVFASLFRSVIRRRTVGLLFRAQEAAEGCSARLRLKRFLLRVLLRRPLVTTLSIVPFPVAPTIATVADGWIDDPQLWDIEDISPPSTPLSCAISDRAKKRKIVVSLGHQTAAKGFEVFCDAWCSRPDLRADWLFVAAGKLAPEMAENARAFLTNGGLLIDRFIEDEELASLYGVADVVWAVYAPHYDQASGVFGRAVQYDVPLVVRNGSVIDRHAKLLGVRAAALDFDNLGDLETSLAKALNASSACVSVDGLRSRSTEVLLRALGLGGTRYLA